MRVRKAGIILRRDSEEPRMVAAELSQWFAERGISAVVDWIDPDLDLLVILGGDGTLLHVADRASEFEIPVLGINLGDLGFLTEVEVADRLTALENILAGSLVIEERLMLKARVCAPGGNGAWRPALNDVVISRGSLDRLPRLAVWADD